MFRLPFSSRKTDPTKSVRLPSLQSERIFLRFPHLDDYEEWATLRAKSKATLQPWEPKWPEDALSLSRYRDYLSRYRETRHNNTQLVFFIMRREDECLIGGISLGNIRRGVVQSGQIGYWCGTEFSGRGYMREGLDLLIAFAFEHLKLHRLEAASIPTNNRSIKLLERCGFKKEGLLRSYVKINGQWQDHVLYALLEDDVRTRPQQKDLR